MYPLWIIPLIHILGTPLLHILLIHEMCHHRAAGNDAHEHIAVIHYGYKVLIQQAILQGFDGGGNTHGRGAIRDDLVDARLFQIALLQTAHAHDVPEEVSLADAAEILPLTGDDGNRGIAVPPKFFHALAKTAPLGQVSNAAFRNEKKCNIHTIGPSLEPDSGWKVEES